MQHRAAWTSRTSCISFCVIQVFFLFKLRRYGILPTYSTIDLHVIHEWQYLPIFTEVVGTEQLWPSKLEVKDRISLGFKTPQARHSETT